MQLTDPKTFITINSYSNILQSKGIGILNTHFDFNFREPLCLIAYNYSDSEQVIYPGDIIATLSFYYFQEIDVREASPIVFPSDTPTKDNNWVQNIIKAKKEEQALVSNENFTSKNMYTKKYINNLIADRLK